MTVKALKKEKRSPWRLAVGVLSALLTVWALLPPLANGIVNVGVVVPVAVGTVGMLWGFSRPRETKVKGWRRAMTAVLIGLICIVAAAAVLFITLMAVAATRPPAGEDATLIVLGAKINGDRPSLMLSQRLNVAAEYLRSHPQTACIVSGGQGPDEAYTEAHVMKTYLVEQGIEPDRIYEEGRSTNTHENIEYSMAIIREQGLSEQLLIATQEFHQYRASVLAKWQGVEQVGALTCASPPHLLLCYWVRECAAICRLWLLHY